MIRRVAWVSALVAVTIDGLGAGLDAHGGHPLPLRFAAIVTALALVPCATSFLVAIGQRIWHRPAIGGAMRTIDTMRLPLVVPRGYVGAAVLGGIATLAAMGESFGLYIFLAGVALIALALSQAGPRNGAMAAGI